MATEDGWRSAIHGCKEDEKNKRLDEDKRKVARQKIGAIFFCW